MTISLEQIKSLRDATGVSITACKKALEEANGDPELAIEVLRKKGESKALERADRVTGEGAIGVVAGNGKVAMVVLGSETDFVSKSPDFIAAMNSMAERVLAEGESTDLTGAVTDLGSKMGEKVELKKANLVEGEVIGFYVHSNLRLAAIVALKGGNEEVARDVAMHITACDPQFLSPSEVSQELLDKEYVIWNDELKNSGKPEAIWSKILEGKEKKFREEKALLTQSFVKNPDLTIEKYLESNGAKISSFVAARI